MRSRFPNSRSRLIAASAAFAVCALVAGCGRDAVEVAAGPALGDAPDSVIVGPQGGRGQFVVQCGFDRFAPDDPIVHPGEPGASHLHQFFGAVGVTATSAYDELLSAGTTCEQHADTASYWAPTLLDADGSPVEPIGSIAYYRAGVGVDPQVVEPYPAGLMLVAGDHTAIEPQPLSVVAWSCDNGGRREITPPDCRGTDSLRMLVTFPDCWDGRNLRTPDPADLRGHVAYSTAGACPDDFPVHIPQLQFSVAYAPLDPAGLALSSGSILSGHADFWNAWDQGRLEREVRACLVRNLPCSIYSSLSI